MIVSDKALRVATDWWIDQILSPGILSQEIGDRSEVGIVGSFFLASLRDKHAIEDSKDLRDKWFHAIQEKMEEVIKPHWDKIWLRVDYDPNVVLAHACKETNISSRLLPLKTDMCLMQDYGVNVRHGYGAPTRWLCHADGSPVEKLYQVVTYSDGREYVKDFPTAELQEKRYRSELKFFKEEESFMDKPPEKRVVCA